jgi:adenylate kinase family enzyme
MKDITLNAASKILVIGTSGSGKTTLAAKISQILNIKNIELDALFWKENWAQSRDDEFRGRIAEAMRGANGYVIHGNYNKVKDLTWGNVDTVIWLDYSRIVVMWRVLKRTIGRIITQEELWAGNKETFKKSFLEKDSIVAWAWSTYGKRKKQYSMMVKDNPFEIENYIVLKHPNEAKSFLKSLEGSRCPPRLDIHKAGRDETMRGLDE